MKRLLLAQTILYAFSPAQAEELYTMPDIVVQGTRAQPVGETRLKAGSGVGAASSDTAGWLKSVPGVQAMGAGGVSSLPSIRGLADERLSTRVDGMEILAACPNHMNPALSYVDPAQVEEVRIYRGVSPVSAGGDAIGASIQVKTKTPQFSKPGEAPKTSGEIGASYRSNGNVLSGRLRADYANERFAIGYAGATVDADNYHAGKDFKTYTFTGRAGHTLDRDEVGSSAYRSTNHALSLAWRLDEKSQLEFKYLRQDIPFEGFPNQRMDMTDNQSDKFNLNYTANFGWGKLKAQVFHERIEHEMDFGPDKRFWYGPASGGNNPPGGNATPCAPIGPTCAAGMPMYTDGKNSGLSVSGEIPLSAQDSLLVGADFRAQRLDDWWPPSGAGMWPNTFWNIRDGQRDRYALYGEWQGQRGNWRHTLGVRHETVKMDTGDVTGYLHATPPTSGAGGMGNQTTDAVAFNTAAHKKTDHNWDVSWLARFAENKSAAYETGLARKTRSPGLYERYTWSTWQMAAFMNNFVGDGNGYVGDINLKPEVAYTTHVSGEWRDAEGAWRLKLSPYISHVDDYIDAICISGCVPNNFRVLRYANHDARLYGLDVEVESRLAKNTAWGDWLLSGYVGYTRGRNLDTDDNLYNIMPLNAKLAVRQNLGGWEGKIEGEFVSEKDKRSSVRQEMRTEGYAFMHLRGTYKWKQAKFEFGVENVFDRGYDLPLGGAYVGQGTTMTIPPLPNQPQWGTPVPGPGRTFYLGFNYSL